MKTRLSTLLLAGLLAACGDSTMPPMPAEVVVTPGSATLTTTGRTVAFSAEVRDEAGRPMTDVQVSWRSTDPSVAEIGLDGTATAISPGEVTIEATTGSGGPSGSAILEVELVAATLAKAAGDEQISASLTELPVRPTVVVRDSAGVGIRDATVVYQVESGGGGVAPITAITDATGEASTRRTLGPDTDSPQRLRASIDGLSVEFTAFADPGAVAILTTELDDARRTLAYARPLEATGGSGEGFVWSLDTGALPPGLTLLPEGGIAGAPTAEGDFDFTLRVTDGGGTSGIRPLSLRVCDAPLSLAPGQSVRTDVRAPDGCAFFLPAGDSGDLYRVAVLNPTWSDDASFSALRNTTVSLGTGAGSTVAPGPVVASAVAPSVDGFLESMPGAFAEDVRVSLETARFHTAMRESEAALLRHLGPEVRPLESGRDLIERAAAPVLAAFADPPDRITIDTGTPSNCDAGSRATGLLVAFDDRIAIYQDSAQRAGPDAIAVSSAEQMLAYYAAYGESTILNLFGGVGDINDDGRVVVFVSTSVPDNIAAFVWSGDFFSVSQCPASNEMELVFFNADVINRIEEERYNALAVLVHEVKHVSSLYKRVRASMLHPSWIEEGTADVAAERSSRVAWAATGGPGPDFKVTREAKLETGVTPENYGMLIVLSKVLLSYASPVNSVTTNPGPSPNHTFYGTSWNFHSFLGDAYAEDVSASEPTFFRTLNDSLSMAGVPGIEARVGRDYETLFEEMVLAMLLDGTGAPAPARTFQSYDMPSIMTQLLQNQDQSAPGAFPWPVTGPEGPAPFAAGTWTGFLAPSGVRIHDFESNGFGVGVSLQATVEDAPGEPARVLIVRIR